MKKKDASIKRATSVGVIIRAAVIARVAALFGAPKIFFSDLFFLLGKLQDVKNKNFKKLNFFVYPYFKLKVKTVVFL